MFLSPVVLVWVESRDGIRGIQGKALVVPWAPKSIMAWNSYPEMLVHSHEKAEEEGSL